MVAMIALEQLATLQELGPDLLLFRMELERERVKRRDSHCSPESQDKILATGIAKLVTIPVDLLRVDTVAATVFGMFKVAASRELGCAVTAPFLGIDGRSWLEDGPQMFECDDLVLDVVAVGSNSILELCLEGCVQQLEMSLGLFVFLLIEGLRKLSPSVNKRVEWCLKDESSEAWRDA